MSSPLLATKIFVPPLWPNRVSRPRLLEKLNEGLRPGCRLILVSAPAGFGKTTLACEWARQTGLPLAWLSLDESDNDAARFWQYAVAALQGIEPTLGVEMSTALQLSQPPPLESLIVGLINDLSVFSRPVLLMLDDYHLVESEAIHRTIGFFLDHQPPHVHLGLLTRADPPLHLARRRARGELCEVRAADLRFAREETRSFFSRTMKLDLTAEDVDALENRTEGWVAGLQMAAIAAQGRTDTHAFVSAISGDDRYIADYLVEEVLQRQPVKVRDFLLRTSILQRFNAGLCDFLVLGQEFGKEGISTPGLPLPSAPDSAMVLEYLERSNLFIMPLDNRRTWFRYHHLFAQLLQQRLSQAASPETIHGLYRQASEWHLQNGYLVEAVEYTLAGGDFEEAARLVEQVIGEMFTRGELTTLQRWAELIPARVLATNPRLCVALAWAAISTNHPRLGESLIVLAEKRVGMTVEEFLDLDGAARKQLSAETLGALLEMSVQRTRFAMDRGDFKVISGKFVQVLPYLTAERDRQPFLFNPPSLLRPAMLFMLAAAEEMQGHIRAALPGFEEAARVAMEWNNIQIILLALGHFGQGQVILGDLASAEATFHAVLDGAARWGGEQISAFYAISHVGLGMLAYERNDLQAARPELDRGIALGHVWDSWEALVPGHLGLGMVSLAMEDREGVVRAIEVLKGLEKNNLVVVSSAVKAALAQLWLRQGQVDQARAWARQAGYDLDGDLSPIAPDHAMLLARLLLADGAAGRAQRLLENQADQAEAAGYWGVWVRLECLLSLSLAAQGRRQAALDCLLAALERAAPGGFVRLFVDEGPLLGALLASLRPQVQEHHLKAYLDRLLAAFPEPLPGPAAPAVLHPPARGALVEPLSARELEVLEFLAQGVSNAGIAEKAYISVNTVKKHITSIYAKLGVTTRVQAVEKARELNQI